MARVCRATSASRGVRATPPPMITLVHSARDSSSSVQPSSSATAAAAACEAGESLSSALASCVLCCVEAKSIWPRRSVRVRVRVGVGVEVRVRVRVKAWKRRLSALLLA